MTEPLTLGIIAAAVAVISALVGALVAIRGQLVTSVENLERRLDASLRRERVRDDYIHRLRDHIAQKKAPPPPPWPEELTDIR